MKFKKEDVVVVKKHPYLGFIAIKDIDYDRFYGTNNPLYWLYNNQYYFEDELVSRKEYEYSKEFEKLLDNN